MKTDPSAVRELVLAALREDLGGSGPPDVGNDLTTRALVPADHRSKARIVARERLVLAGIDVAREVFHTLDSELLWRAEDDGTEAGPDDAVATIEGRSRPILTGERTALNFLQKLSGIATAARRAVREVEGTRTVILDTRKTTPTLRALEKYAVTVGGASNHRFGLHDAVMVKDNHVAIAGGVREALERLSVAGADPGEATVEVDDLDGLREALDAGARRVLLDNFDAATAARAVKIANGRARIECSGGLRPGSLRAHAEAGAHFLSLGWLTHSAPAADLSLEIEELT